LKFSDQVVSALKQLHPGVRRDIRRALDDVSTGRKRDVGMLTDKLTGFWRLRVGKYRVVFRCDKAGELVAEFLGPRKTVYRSFKPPEESS
jgi:mRNA interferase RelE/StbE